MDDYHFQCAGFDEEILDGYYMSEEGGNRITSYNVCYTKLLRMEPIEEITLLGEWNTWKGEPMKKKKNGDYYLTKVLNKGNSYNFV